MALTVLALGLPLVLQSLSIAFDDRAVMVMRRRLVRMVLACVMVSGGAGIVSQSPVAAAIPNFATVAATATCPSGQTLVSVNVVWNNGSGAQSKAVTPTRFLGYANAAYFRTTISLNGRSTSVRYEVGCRPSPGSSLVIYQAPARSVTGSLVYNTRCSGTTSRTCAGAPRVVGDWPYDAGYCTDGADQMWRRATGGGAGWGGDANEWNERASGQGARVSPVPHERALVVFETGAAQPGGGTFESPGHVGFVTRVLPPTTGTTFQFTYIDMNGSGVLYQWATRTYTFTPNTGKVSFIVANPGSPVSTHP